jgi:predicted CopG family antitoxin
MEFLFNDIGLSESINLKNKKDLHWRLTSKLKKKYGFDNLANILTNEGFVVKKCKICNRYINFNIIFDDHNDHLKVKDIQHLTRYSNYQYCYGYYKDCPGIKMNSNSAEFISKVRDISIDDALQYIKKNNKSPFYKENHNNLNEYKKSQSRDKNFFISRYGKVEGIKRWKNAQDKADYSRSLDGYIEKYGKIKGSMKWHEYQKSKDTMSRSKFKTEEEYKNRIKEVLPTYDNFIRRYGKIKGEIKWDEYSKNRKCGASKWSNNLIDKIIDSSWFKLLPIEKMYYYNHSKYGEYVICDENNKNCFMYDFTIFFKNDKKIIIENHGNVFHANENLSINERNKFKHPFSKESFSEVLERDIKKRKRAEDKGFTVLYLWDTETDENNIKLLKSKIYELLK